MSGRHEPPTNRSFYFSLATSTLRFAIIVALVVGGVALISQAFPEGPSTAGPPSGSSESQGPSPTQTPTSTPRATQTPQVAGVVLGVYNGTEVTGLAADTADKLERRFGYSVPTDPGYVGDTPTKPVEVTILYYASPSDRVEAEYLAAKFLKDITPQIEKLSGGTDIPSDVQVAVYLGNDYAATINVT
jgi:hypothetical protein